MKSVDFRVTPDLLREYDVCAGAVSALELWLESRGWSSARITSKNARDAYAYSDLLNLSRLVETGAVPSDDSIRKVCIKEGPFCAYLYARYSYRTPRRDTRKAACKDPFTAYAYAVRVDYGPRDDTRTAACRNARYAYEYALYVDKRRHPVTYASVREDLQYGWRYEEYFGKS